MPSRLDAVPRHVWRLLAFMVVVLAGVYLLVSPACECVRESEARRHEEAQFSDQ